MFLEAKLELWLVRHGESMWNIESRIQGHSNSPLSELGIKQAKLLQKRLVNHDFDAVYSSDLARAKDTAELALPSSHIELDKRLRERNFAGFEGKTQQDLSTSEKEVFEAWRNDPENIRPLGGELQSEILKRILAWLANLPKTGKVIAFTHGGVVRTLLFWVVGAKASYARSFLIGNSSINKLYIHTNKIHIATVNDTAHLEGGFYDNHR